MSDADKVKQFSLSNKKNEITINSTEENHKNNSNFEKQFFNLSTPKK